MHLHGSTFTIAADMGEPTTSTMHMCSCPTPRPADKRMMDIGPKKGQTFYACSNSSSPCKFVCWETPKRKSNDSASAAGPKRFAMDVDAPLSYEDLAAIDAAIAKPPPLHHISPTPAPAQNQREETPFSDVLCTHNLPCKSMVTRNSNSVHFNKRFYACALRDPCKFWRLHSTVVLDRARAAGTAIPTAAVVRTPDAPAGSGPNGYRARHQELHDRTYGAARRKLGESDLCTDGIHVGGAHPHLYWKRKEAFVKAANDEAKERGYECAGASAWEETYSHVDAHWYSGLFDRMHYVVHMMPAVSLDLDETKPVQYAWLWIPICGQHEGDDGPIVGRASHCTVIAVALPDSGFAILRRSAVWRYLAEKFYGGGKMSEAPEQAWGGCALSLAGKRVPDPAMSNVRYAVVRADDLLAAEGVLLEKWIFADDEEPQVV